MLPDVARERLLVAERPAWAGSGPASWSLVAISPAADTLWHYEEAYEPVTLPAERLDSAAAAWGERLHGFLSRFEPGLTVATLRGRIDEAMYRPAWYPPVGQLVAGHDGSVWVELGEPVAGEPGTTWLVLDEGGQPLGRVRAPAGLQVLAADRDHVWGVVTDELDVNYIVRHAVERSAPGG